MQFSDDDFRIRTLADLPDIPLPPFRELVNRLGVSVDIEPPYDDDDFPPQAVSAAIIAASMRTPFLFCDLADWSGYTVFATHLGEVLCRGYLIGWNAEFAYRTCFRLEQSRYDLSHDEIRFARE